MSPDANAIPSIGAAPGTVDAVGGRLAASRRLLPLLWGGQDVEAEARELLEAARAANDAEGECGALYVSMAVAAVAGDGERSRVVAVALMQRGSEAGLQAWESLGRTHLSRLHLTDQHEDLALGDVVEAELLLDDLEPTVTLAVACTGVAATYSRLALYEDSERLYARTAEVLNVARDDWAEQALIYNRLLNEATWGLALHRTGKPEKARERLTIAAAQVRASRDLSGSRLWCDLASLCLFADLMTGAMSADDALEELHVVLPQGNVETESFVRFALAHSFADVGKMDEARLQVTAGLEAVHPIEGGPVRNALYWERARIAVKQDPDHAGLADVWSYAQITTGQVWELRQRRLDAAHDRIRLGRLRREHERIEQAAHEDALTGLGNRRRLDLLRESLQSDAGEGWTTVAYVDIDRFKEVNDTHGHELGDDVLRVLASLLQTHTRAGDVVGRYGGDEFVIVARDYGPESAVRLADRVIAAVRMYDWRSLHPSLAIRLSAGVATARRDPDRLFARADEALYTAKRSGRDRAELVVLDDEPAAEDAAGSYLAAAE